MNKTSHPPKESAPNTLSYTPQDRKSCGWGGLAGRFRPMNANSAPKRRTISRQPRVSTTYWKPNGNLTDTSWCSERARSGHTHHLTFDPLDLTRRPPDLTFRAGKRKTGLTPLIARRQYDKIIDNVPSYTSYVSLWGGVCTRAHTRVAQASPPSPENRVRCVRSGVTTEPSAGFHPTLTRKKGVSTPAILRKMESGFKTGQINGGDGK